MGRRIPYSGFLSRRHRYSRRKQGLSSQPWRILYLTTDTQLGGAERSIIELVRRINPRRYHSSIASLYAGGPFHALARAACADVATHELGWKGATDLRGIARLFHLLRHGCYDLVQINGLTANTLGRPLCVMARVPVIVSAIRSTDLWRKAYHVWLDRSTAWFVDLWISNSEAGRVACIRREHFRPELIVTAHTGIDADSLIAQADLTDPHMTRRSLDLPASAAVVGHVANLRLMKGHREIIEAVPRVLAKYPNTYFVFVGRDDLGGAIQRLAKRHAIADKIRFTGYRNDVPSLLRIFDLVLLPSVWEGFPYSLLEAMALGKPVVATAVGGIPELVTTGETGLLLDTATPQAIAEAIVNLLSDRELRERLGRQAAVTVRRDFNHENHVAKMESIYSDLIANRAKCF